MPGGTRPTRVSLFVTCLIDLLYPEIADATVRLLRDLDVEVDVPGGQTCCGQPAYNAGFPGDARRMAGALIGAIGDGGTVVTSSGSCAAMVRSNLPTLFSGTPHQERARGLAERTFELSQFLVDELGVEGRIGSLPARVTFHDACHGLRELGLASQGRRLLAGIEGLELVEMARPDACCGFGGTFSVRLPEMATAMGADKLGQAGATGADLLVTGDAGCLMHLAGLRSRRDRSPRPVHLAVLLAQARGLLAPEGPDDRP
ncbi:MAG TPA: (Fe-S)-binding protein [Actinomycetota bacterium]|jgi:L-lactate dehydrogenase complex protein LldE|nr:(Fe-S)-binding protein [Actinomycetota bacterium]